MSYTIAFDLLLLWMLLPSNSKDENIKKLMSFCYLYIITVILCVIYCTIVTYYIHCEICKVHTFFVKNTFCATNIVFKTFVVNRIIFMHYIYFIFMLYTLFLNATVCKHYKVKILKMNANRTNRKVINFAYFTMYIISCNCTINYTQDHCNNVKVTKRH
jgi:hypothetical protein